MNEPKKRVKRLGLVWRYQIQENQKYAPLVEYLNSDEELPYPRAEMFLQAISAFWYPIALKWKGKSEEEVKAAISFAIRVLEIQIAFLKSHLNEPQSNNESTKECTKEGETADNKEKPQEAVDNDFYKAEDEHIFKIFS